MQLRAGIGSFPETMTSMINLSLHAAECVECHIFPVPVQLARLDQFDWCPIASTCPSPMTTTLSQRRTVDNRLGINRTVRDP